MSANNLTPDELKKIIDPEETTPEGRDSVEGKIKENVEAGLKELTVEKIENMTSEDFLTAVLDNENTNVFGALSGYLTEIIDSEELRDGYVNHVKGGLRALIVRMIDNSKANDEVKSKLRELFEGDESQALEGVEEVEPEAVANLLKVGQDNQLSQDLSSDKIDRLLSTSPLPTPPPPPSPFDNVDSEAFQVSQPATHQSGIGTSFEGDYTDTDMGDGPSLYSFQDEFNNVNTVQDVADVIKSKINLDGHYVLRGMDVSDFDLIATVSGLARDGEALLRDAAEIILKGLPELLEGGLKSIRINFNDDTLEYTLEADGKVVSEVVDEEEQDVDAKEGENKQAAILRAIKGLHTFKLHRLDPKIGGWLKKTKLSDLLEDSEVNRDEVLGALVNQLNDRYLTFKRGDRYQYSPLIKALEGYLRDKVNNSDIDSLSAAEAKMLMRLESADKGIHDDERQHLVDAKAYLKSNLGLEAAAIDSAPFVMLDPYSIDPKAYLDDGSLILNDSPNPKVTISLRNFRTFEQKITLRIRDMVNKDFNARTTEFFGGKSVFEYDKKVDFMLKHKLIVSLEDLLESGPITVTPDNMDMLQGLLKRKDAPSLLPMQARFINDRFHYYQLDLRDDHLQGNNAGLAIALSQHADQEYFTENDAKLVLENIKKDQISTLDSDIARKIIAKLKRLNLPKYDSIKDNLIELIDACNYAKHEAALMKSCVEDNRNILSINELNSLCKQGSESTWSEQLKAVRRELQAGASLYLKELDWAPELALALAKTAAGNGLSTIELEDVTLTEWKTIWLNTYAQIGGADWLTSRVGFLEGYTAANAKKGLKRPDDKTIRVMQIVLPAAANKTTGDDGSLDTEAFLRLLADDFNANEIDGSTVALDADLIKNYPQTPNICQRVFDLLKSRAESELRLTNLEGFGELFSGEPDYQALLKHFNDMSPAILAKMIFVEGAKDNKNRSDASLSDKSLEGTIFERSASVHAKSLLDQLPESGEATVEKLSDQVAVICLIIEEGLDWDVDVRNMKMELTEDQVREIREKLTERSEAREKDLEKNFKDYLKGSQRNAVRRKPEGVTLRMQADEFVSEFLEDLSHECRHILDEINPTDRLLAINEFLDFNLIEDNGGMSEYAKVALAFYFDLRGDVGSERFEKDLRKKLEAIMIEEADLDLDEDHTEFDLESEYSRTNREDVFKRQLYKQMLAKYGAENLKDPEVRNKFTNEVTMAMMQERLDRLEAKMEESTIVDKLEGAWKWCNQAKSVLLPGLATLGLFGSYMKGGIGALFSAYAGEGTMIASGMSAVGQGILGYSSWTAAYLFGSSLALGKTLQAVSKIGLPPFLKGNQNLDEAAFEIMQHGGNLSLRNGEVQVANINEGDKGNKKQVRNLRRQFKITRKEIMKNSRDTVRDNLGSQTKSSLILDTINNAYNVADFDSVNRVKKSNKRAMHMAGSLFAGVGHAGFLGATALLPAIYKRMK